MDTVEPEIDKPKIAAIIRTGGKQYAVQEGSIVVIEKLKEECGREIVFEDVLLYQKNGDVKIGTPLVSDVKVVGKIVEQFKGPKIRVFKKQRRKGKQVTKGHRQNMTRVRIESISH